MSYHRLIQTFLKVILAVLLLSSGGARAQIALHNGSTNVYWVSAATETISVTNTVGTNAVLVVLLENRGNNAVAPSTLSWNGVTLTQISQQQHSAQTQRGIAIYYLYSPPIGTNNLAVTVPSAGTVALTAYTLSGVNTNVAPLVGGANTGSSGGTTLPSFTINNVLSNSWAAVNETAGTAGAIYTNTATGTNNVTYYVTNGVYNDTVNGNVQEAGYVGPLPAGAITFSALNPGQYSAKDNYEAVVFTPAGEYPPPPPPVTVNSVILSTMIPNQGQNVTITANVTYSNATPNTVTLDASGLNSSASAVAMGQQSYNSGTGLAVYTNTVTVTTNAPLGATTLTVVASDTLGDLATNSVIATVTQLSTNVLQSAFMKLVVQAVPFSFQVIELSSGTVLLQQTANQFTIGSTYNVSYATNFVITATTLDADLVLSGTSATGHITFNFIQPGILQTTLSSSNNTSSQIYQQFADQGEDMFGGFECPTGGTLSGRNFSSQLAGCLQLGPYVYNSGGHAPFYLTTRHYGIYAETDALGTLTLAQSGHTSFSFNVPQLTYDIIYGTNYATIMAGFNSRTIPSYMPPTWAFDSVWWKDDDHSSLPAGVTNAQGNVLDTANKLALYQIRASSEWIDRPYGSSCGQGDGGWGNMDWDTSNTGFNNPTQMVNTLQTNGLNLMLWITDLCWCNLYNEALANGWLFYTNDNSTVNLSNTNTYVWFQTNLNNYVNYGIKGYKIDRGDQNEIPAAVNNQNDTLFQQLAMQGVSALHPNDTFVFSRTVSDTGRSYSALWNGDTFSTFGGLQYSIIAGLRAGILDFPMWGSDTGGYENNPVPTEELFDRWLEFSSYSTIMEVLHGGGRTPWYNYSTNFNSPTNVVAIAAAQTGAHHDLMPYSRSLLYQATQNGMPVMRPIMFGYPNDTNESVTITNCEYLFGPNILVAPVITAGATSRSVYLPADQWLDYNTKSNLYTGPANIIAAAPIQTIPLFVNQGAIIPRGDIWQGNNMWTSNWAPNLRIEFFPSENSGNSFPYYTGSSVQNIACANQNHTLNIQFGDLGYAGNLQVYLQSLGSVAGTVVSNGVSLTSGAGYTYNPATHLLQVPFNGPTTLVVSNAGSLFSPLEAWRVANFGNPSDPAVSGDSANPSGDGIPNLLKYAFGLNPLAVSTNGLPFESIVNNSGTNYLALTFPRATNATDCTFTVLVTTNLVGQLSQWQTGSSYSGTSIISNTANTTEVSRMLTNNVEMITVRDNVPMTAAPQRFMTVRVTIP